MPSDDHNADYFDRLVDCLNCINDGERGARSHNFLVSHLRPVNDDGTQISLQLARRRVEFMSELELIARNDNNRWQVTEEGLKLGKDDDSRWWLFGRLLCWCEERGDEQFRVLLHAIERSTSGMQREIYLADLPNKIPAADRLHWWSDNYNLFCSQSCQARNWLVSLGVLARKSHGASFYYQRGKLYERLTPWGTGKLPFDARLNEVSRKASA